MVLGVIALGLTVSGLFILQNIVTQLGRIRETNLDLIRAIREGDAKELEQLSLIRDGVRLWNEFKGG